MKENLYLQASSDFAINNFHLRGIREDDKKSENRFYIIIISSYKSTIRFLDALRRTQTKYVNNQNGSNVKIIALNWGSHIYLVFYPNI